MRQSTHPHFEELIKPMKPDKFWQNIFEHQHCLFESATSKVEFKLKDFEKLLWSHQEILEGKVQVNKAGENVYYNKAAAGKDMFRWLMDQYLSGCTIIFNGLERLVPKIAHFVQPLDDVFLGQTTVNAFLTPPGAQGFLPHFDTHDVFILQTDGHKTWLLWDKQIELPLDKQIYLIDQEKLGEPKSAIEMKSGNVLYIPKGEVHGAQTSKSFSLHLTIGVRPLMGLDYLKTLIDVISENDVELRRNILNKDLTSSDDLTNNLIKILESHSKDQEIKKQVYERIQTEHLSWLKPLPGHHLENINSVDSLQLNSEVEKAFDKSAVITESDGEFMFVFPGLGFSDENDALIGNIGFPVSMENAFRFILDCDGPFQVADLPDTVSEKSKMLIVRTLVEQGYLKLV